MNYFGLAILRWGATLVYKAGHMSQSQQWGWDGEPSFCCSEKHVNSTICSQQKIQERSSRKSWLVRTAEEKVRKILLSNVGLKSS